MRGVSVLPIKLVCAKESKGTVLWNSCQFTFDLPFSFRGVYLASVLFTDDEKLLVTLDENIPIIEVDDSHPSTFLQDFCWLMKVFASCFY